MQVSRDDPAPMHAQLERELRAAVRGGRLAANTALPSTRSLAGQLGVSRGVVVEAYEQLVAEGYLVGRHGSATRVAAAVRLYVSKCLILPAASASHVLNTIGRT